MICSLPLAFPVLMRKLFIVNFSFFIVHYIPYASRAFVDKILSNSPFFSPFEAYR